MLYIQDDRYFGSLYGLETHDKRKKCQKLIFFRSKTLLHLWGGWTQFIENFLHESILSYPITSLKTSRQQHFTGAHKSSTSQKAEIPILLFKNWSKLIPHDRTTFLGKIDRGYLVQTQFSRLEDETFLVTGPSAQKFYQIYFVQKGHREFSITLYYLLGVIHKIRNHF